MRPNVSLHAKYIVFCLISIFGWHCSSTPEQGQVEESVPDSNSNIADNNVDQFNNFSENFNNNDFFENEFNNNEQSDDNEQFTQNDFENNNFFNNQFENQGQFNNDFTENNFNENNFGENFNNETNNEFSQQDNNSNNQFSQENFNNQAFFANEPFQEQAFTFQDQEQLNQLPSQNVFAAEGQLNLGQENDFLTEEEFAQNSQLNLEDPLANAQPVAPAPEVVPNAASPDLEAVSFTLHWIGMRFLPIKKKIKLQIETKGTPQFEVFQEQNRSSQPELVLRFYQTKRRAKLKWDIDASEFRSPLAHIRTRELVSDGITDVVLTLREASRPKFFAEKSNITLTFDIPAHYFNEIDVVEKKIVGKQSQTMESSRIGLILAENSERPLVRQASNEPKGNTDDGTDIEEVMSNPLDIDENGLPDNFSFNDREDDESIFIVERENFGMQVGQDNGENNFNINVDDDNQFFEQSNNIEFLNQNNNSQNEEGDFGEENFGEGNFDDNNFAGDEFQNNLDFSEQNFKQQDLFENQDQQNLFGNQQQEDLFDNQDQQNLFGNQDQLQNQGKFVEQNLNSQQEQNQNLFGEQSDADSDLIGEESTDDLLTQKSKYKVIYMEFTDAPLSIVFKSFSAETGNNFIYPKSVGELTISIHFQGVPWDEALRAILETHSLGMVRVGDNIVRVDAVERLTDYLQALERAQQFETRRAPTKILVFRLNNAKAAEVAERISALLNRDRQIDPRIQVSPDERTNSIVIEAAEHTIAKAKNIIDRLDLKTPQVEIASRIVEVTKTSRNDFGISWLNQALLNFDPGRGLGFGSLNFPNSLASSFAVDPGIRGNTRVGNAQFRFGSINRFLDLDLLLRMEETKGTTNVLQSNRVLVLDGREATILAGSSRFFRPAAGGVNVGGPGAPAAGGGDQGSGLAEVKFNLSLQVTPQVTADGAVILDLNIKSDTPGNTTGETLADKSTRELTTQMVRDSGDTGVIGGIYDTSKTETVIGIPFLSSIPIIGALFRATTVNEDQTELLIMVTPTIMSGKREGIQRQENFAVPKANTPISAKG